MMTWRVVQVAHPARGRGVAVVDGANLRLIADAPSVYALARRAIAAGQRLEDVLSARQTNEALPYEALYTGRSAWSLLPPFDHPDESARCFVTGTGLTHKASAENRQSMHAAAAAETDSMKMYRIGLEGGRPQPGCIGSSPEWFYKGVGTILKAHNEPLDVPSHGDDGGDEAEIAGCYLIGDDGQPYRVGLAQGNEFSDHLMEAKNYLYLAQSKLRACALGPELVIGGDLSAEIRGQARIERGGGGGGAPIWSGPLASGEPWMCHSLANLEHHHFKHDEHRRPGDAHVHFFGADLFSFKDRLRLEDGDVMVVSFEGFGRPLRNPIRIDRRPQPFVGVRAL